MGARKLQDLVPLLAFTGSYLAAALIGVAVTGNKEFVFYLVVMAILIAVILLVDRRVHLSTPLLWALSIWGGLHMAGGLVPVPAGWPYNPPSPVLYSLWLIPDFLKYDHVIHFYGFAVTTWLCWEAWSSIVRDYGGALRPSFGVLVLCAAAGMGFGALNEIVEFIAVLSIPNTNVGGYENTGWDLVCNFLGAVAAAIWIRFRARA